MKKNNRNKSVSIEAMNARKEKISNLIDSAIQNINQEINLHKDGLESDSTIEILQKIKSELEIMRKFLSPQQFKPTYNYIIVDSWNEFNHLGEQLLNIVHEYNEKLI